MPAKEKITFWGATSNIGQVSTKKLNEIKQGELFVLRGVDLKLLNLTASYVKKEGGKITQRQDSLKVPLILGTTCEILQHPTKKCLAIHLMSSDPDGNYTHHFYLDLPKNITSTDACIFEQFQIKKDDLEKLINPKDHTIFTILRTH